MLFAVPCKGWRVDRGQNVPDDAPISRVTEACSSKGEARLGLEGWPIRTRRDRRCTPSWQRIRATCQRDESSGTAEKICAP